MDEKEMSMREALNLALDQAMAADDRVFLLGEDIADPGASGPTAGLSTKYGHDRVLDTPISEAAIVGAAVGAAIDGLLPVAENHDHGLHRHRRGPDHQQRRQTALHDRRADDGSHHGPHPGVWRARHRRDALADARGVVHAHPGVE